MNARAIMLSMDLFPAHDAGRSAPPRRRPVGGRVRLLTVLAFSTLPTPLYAIYQVRDGFSTFLITVIFAAYAVGVTLALFFAGHASDWLGRRRMLVPAILTSLLSAGVFLVWRDLPGLLLARVLNGLSVGVVTATATAYLAELNVGGLAQARPGAGDDGQPRRARHRPDHRRQPGHGGRRRR